ncbi:sensor histidine kinase [Algibacter miyuki]|uniref:Sensor histidine kinase n=1 Tax=Algibacter miyuki TaxID=1306933 RepID=A0ABV5GX10_9FLAO|nr:sensor histidine kinase [Algibacter miyuki]MDN3666130.1 sensor histidine kinase [Algibacter miyuki]
MSISTFLGDKYRKQFVLHFSVWTIFVFVHLIQVRPGQDVISVSNLFLFVTNIILFYLNYLYLVPKLLLKKKTGLYVLCGVVFIGLIVFLFRELQPMINKGTMFFERRPGHGRFFTGIKEFMIIINGILILAIGSGIRIYTEWNRNEITKKQIEAQKSLSELHFLKNQISPHFLFNSLNSIYSLTTKKSNDAPEAVITLSELLRYMLYQTNQDFVLLNNELDYVQNYLKLQRLRIANNEHVTLNIHGAINHQKIRPLLLISFIENAFKYGTDFKGRTKIKIEIYVKEDELQFTCVNLIGSRKSDKTSSGIGLQNTRERLKLLYPETHWLTVTEVENDFVVNLTLKLA